jgi:pimeloyl-ACP methyl ester carboxylesterase
VTLDTMVDRTVAALTELPRSVVLVGHSLAGMVISAAAEKAPDRIKTLVFLTALFRITNLIELHSVPASRGRYEELKYPRDHA